MSKSVSVGDLAEGMVVDKDVTNAQGAILLKKGSELTPRHISIFKTWGISSVSIQEKVVLEDLGGKTPEEAAQEELQAVAILLNEKFSAFADDEVMGNIKDLAIKHKSAQVKRKYGVS